MNPARVTLVGARDQEELDLIAPFPADLGIGRIEYRDGLRHADLAALGGSITEELTGDGGKFWLHLDVDVLDQAAFPATDYLMDDGLSLTELKALMGPLASSPGLIGCDITCFNPEKDPDGRYGAELAGLMRSVLSAG